MIRIVPHEPVDEPVEGSKPHLVLPQSERKRQYQRTREFTGFSIDDIVNSRQARKLMAQLWLVGCMVRRPQKAATLPAGSFPDRF